jgi:hypothetical protein
VFAIAARSRKKTVNRNFACLVTSLFADFWYGALLYPKEGGNRVLGNFSELQTNCTFLQFRSYSRCESLGSNYMLLRMASSGMLSRVALLRTRATRRNIPEDAILHNHCHGNLKSYIDIVWRNVACCYLEAVHVISTIH